MKVQFALLAQSVSVDRFSNRLSIFNVMESIETPSFPIFVPEPVYLSLLRKEEGDPNICEATLSMSIGGAVVGKSNLHIDFQDSLHCRQIINWQGIPILEPKNLQLQLALPGQQPHTLEIPVTKAAQTTPQRA